MVQANEVARPMSRHSDRTPLVLGGTQLHGELNVIIIIIVIIINNYIISGCSAICTIVWWRLT